MFVVEHLCLPLCTYGSRRPAEQVNVPDIFPCILVFLLFLSGSIVWRLQQGQLLGSSDVLEGEKQDRSRDQGDCGGWVRFKS